jgi:hypothetical protein
MAISDYSQRILLGYFLNLFNQLGHVFFLFFANLQRMNNTLEPYGQKRLKNYYFSLELMTII